MHVNIKIQQEQQQKIFFNVLLLCTKNSGGKYRSVHNAHTNVADDAMTGKRFPHYWEFCVESTDGFPLQRSSNAELWLFTPQPSGLEGYCRHGPGGRAGGRAGGCQTCGTHISVTAWGIFSIRSSVELSRPVVVHRHGHLPICPKWACPWPKNLSNLVQIGSRLCGTHISETAGWIDPI